MIGSQSFLLIKRTVVYKFVFCVLKVKILRQRFNHSIAPGELAGDSRQTIHGSDFSLSVQEIWKTIKEDRELDLPKHEVMPSKSTLGVLLFA